VREALSEPSILATDFFHTRAAAPKRRETAVEESESEDESGEDDHDARSEEEGEDGKEREFEYDVPRVDFSKILPYEIIVEVRFLLSHFPFLPLTTSPM
jgi:hypothetical protein